MPAQAVRSPHEGYPVRIVNLRWRKYKRNPSESNPAEGNVFITKDRGVDAWSEC